MNVEQMREYLINYPKYARAEKWTSKVRSMPAAQVIAVYMRLSQQTGTRVR